MSITYITYNTYITLHNITLLYIALHYITSNFIITYITYSTFYKRICVCTDNDTSTYVCIGGEVLFQQLAALHPELYKETRQGCSRFPRHVLGGIWLNIQVKACRAIYRMGWGKPEILSSLLGPKTPRVTGAFSFFECTSCKLDSEMSWHNIRSCWAMRLPSPFRVTGRPQQPQQKSHAEHNHSYNKTETWLQTNRSPVASANTI